MTKMRLRVKLDRGEGGPNKSFSVLLGDNCDWQQLQAAVLAKQPQLKGPTLSLNKKVRKTPGPRDLPLMNICRC